MDIIRNCVLMLSVTEIVTTIVVFVIWYATSHASHEYTMKVLKKTLIFISIFVGLTLLGVLFPSFNQMILQS